LQRNDRSIQQPHRDSSCYDDNELGIYYAVRSELTKRKKEFQEKGGGLARKERGGHTNPPAVEEKSRSGINRFEGLSKGKKSFRLENNPKQIVFLLPSPGEGDARVRGRL